MWYRLFKAFPFRPLVRWGFRARIVHPERVPASGGVILAANHIAAIDSIVLPAMVPRRVTFPAKAELFAGKGPIGRIVAWFLRAIGQVPMDRAGGRASAASLREITDLLAGGGVIAIFPEGTRSPDGRLYKGKTGAARMALSVGVPILPVGLVGTTTVKGPLGIGWVRKPVVTIGEPMDFAEFRDRSSDAAVLRWVTDETMAAIQRLTGQEYVDVYGQRVKSGDLAGTGADDHVRERPGGGPPPGRADEAR